MTPMQVLNQVLAGKKVTLEFDSTEQRENFRIRLYKMKKIQDDAAEAVLDDAEKLVMRNTLASNLTEERETFYSTFWTEEKKAPSFRVISVEDNDNGNGTG